MVRDNFTRASLRHPDWFPASFLKWAVDASVYASESYPPYCGGGGYVLGIEAARRVIDEYDARYTRSRIIPVEDAFVGVLASAQGIAPREQLQFQEPTRGSLQTREMFIDQILVHRVAEPKRALEWLLEEGPAPMGGGGGAGAAACAALRSARKNTWRLSPPRWCSWQPAASTREGLPGARRWCSRRAAPQPGASAARCWRRRR